MMSDNPVVRAQYGESLFYRLLGGGVATPAFFVLTDALRAVTQRVQKPFTVHRER